MQKLPSEQAQHLAEYISQNNEYWAIITHYGRVVIDPQVLSKVIQDYWDSQL